MKKNLFYFLIIIFAFSACKKDEESEIDKNKRLLTGATWSLYSTHKKKYTKTDPKILLDTLIIDDCSMKSRLNFKNDGVAEYNNICVITNQIIGTWGIAPDGNIYANLSMNLPSDTGWPSIEFGFPKSEILSLDANEFKRKHIEYYAFIDHGVRTDYVTEVITSYKKVN